jgi:hypothetical protein
MEKQEIFNKSYLGLKTQGKPAKSKYGSCHYIDDCGNKCAIGHLLSDEIAKHWEKNYSDDSSIRSVIKQDGFGTKPWMKDDVAFLSALQKCHDNLENWEDPNNGFEAKFAEFADVWRLEIPNMEKTS